MVVKMLARFSVCIAMALLTGCAGPVYKDDGVNYMPPEPIQVQVITPEAQSIYRPHKFPQNYGDKRFRPYRSVNLTATNPYKSNAPAAYKSPDFDRGQHQTQLQDMEKRSKDNIENMSRGVTARR